MGWSLGFDARWNRDIGYSVPSLCDHSGCETKIDRGLAHVCGGEPYGGDVGCGLYFCSDHLKIGRKSRGYKPVCLRCQRGDKPFFPSEDTDEWIKHKLE